MLWNPEGAKVPEIAVSLDLLLYSNSYILDFLLNFSIKMSPDGFLLELNYRLSITKFLVQHKWNLGSPKLAKCY